jgi:hypothetical protein
VLHRPLRRALLAPIAVLASLAAVPAALGVLGSTLDGEAHPYVGALVGDGALRCTAVLVAPTVAATAGHCGIEGERVAVGFDTRVDVGDGRLLAGTFRRDPSRRADLAVVVLDTAAGTAPAALPPAGAADALARRSTVTSVGYGASGRAADGSWVVDGYRRRAESPLLKAARLTLTVSTREAGPCFGDSGGPQLTGDTVLSLTSGGPKDCTGKVEGYRLDTPAAREFLRRFVTLP